MPHIATLAAAALVACSRLGGDSVLVPTVVGMTEMTPPMFDNGEDQIYEVHTPIRFPVRAPTAEEARKFGPFSVDKPWLEAKEFSIELRYTISNLTDQKQIVQLLVDPWNEFAKYQPAFTVTEEGVQTDLAGHDKPRVVGPKEKLQGTITADDTIEMATDLATVMKIQTMVTDPMANVNALFNNTFALQNRSSAPELTPLIAKYIPKVVPGLTGVTVGFRMGAPASVALEVIVDIVDRERDRVIAPGEEKSKQLLPEPTMIIVPPAAPMN